MNILNTFFNTCIKKYFQFRGRGNRTEYIIFYTICLLLNIVCVMLIYAGFTYIEYLYRFINLMLLIPTVSLTFRRLHDLNISGGYYALLNCFFFIAIIYLMVKDGSIQKTVPMSSITTIFCYSTLVLQYSILIFKKGTTTTNKYGEPPNN
jgi:uncharacterized membrane protein YhaH (DUF805 family)